MSEPVWDIVGSKHVVSKDCGVDEVGWKQKDVDAYPPKITNSFNKEEIEYLSLAQNRNNEFIKNGSVQYFTKRCDFDHFYTFFDPNQTKNKKDKSLYWFSEEIKNNLHIEVNKWDGENHPI